MGGVLKASSFILLGVLLLFSYYSDSIWKVTPSVNIKNFTSVDDMKVDSTSKANNDNRKATPSVNIKNVTSVDDMEVNLTSKSNNDNINITKGLNTHHDNKLEPLRTINQWPEYHINMTTLLSQAQIPPPNSPWHVLPHSWHMNTTTINSSSITEYRSMLNDVRRYIEEEGLILKRRGRPIDHQRLYIIRDGTLLKLYNQTFSNMLRWTEVEDMMQSAMDIGKYLLKSKRRMKQNMSSSSSLRSKSDDYNGTQYGHIKMNLNDHYYSILNWLLGMSNPDTIDDDIGMSSQQTPKSIPILVDKSDFKSCYGNDTKYHIPWFTFAMESASNTYNKYNQRSSTTNETSNCIPFALPCYEMLNHLKLGSKYSPDDWYLNKRNNINPNNYAKRDIHLDLNYQRYPWETKISKVVWRGSSTGVLINEKESWQDLPRFQLVQKCMNVTDIMDVGFVTLNQGWELEPKRSDILSHIPGCLKGSIKFTAFMKYKAILDINGNSWSSRFGHLMCFNSVILKVETNDLINYFESPGGTNSSPELIPWKHYVPVKKDLSNLVEMSRYVLDPKNEDEMLGIIANANKWCQHKMTVTQFAIDTLWMILNYVNLLYFYPNDENEYYNNFSSVDNNSYHHPLNFHWMEQYVYQLHEWKRARGDIKNAFESQVVKGHNGSTFEY